MGRQYVCFTLFLTLLILPEVRSVTCSAPDFFQADGACFAYHTDPLPYADAKLACQTTGKVLAKVTTLSNEFYQEFISQARSKSWIGASDSAQEGTWVWAAGGDAGSELSTLWYFNNPSNATDDYDCAAIFKWILEPAITGVLEIIDDECSNGYPFLCMESAGAPATTEPITNTEASKTGASVTTSSITPLTETNAIMTTKPTLMKCGANCIDFNVLLFITLCAFIYLVI